MPERDPYLTVLAVGTKVVLADGIEGVIQGIAIRGVPPVATYEIGWWSGRDKKEAWFHEWEFRFAGATLRRLGFRSWADRPPEVRA